MKRVLIGFFLILFLFLTSGYSQLLAQSWREARTLVPTKHINASEPGAPQGKFIVEKEPAEGEEDSNTSSSKKYLDSGDVFFAPEFFAHHSVSSLPSGIPAVAYTITSNRYIILRVFRL